MQKNLSRTHSSRSIQKLAPKNSYHSKNETVLKIAKNGHNAKAIAHAKYSVWVKNLKYPKGAKNDCTTTVE